MAKVPAGQTAATWDGAGDVWFKIYAVGPKFGTSLTWPAQGMLGCWRVNYGKLLMLDRVDCCQLQDSCFCSKRRIYCEN